jgi:hypothetical protein
MAYDDDEWSGWEGRKAWAKEEGQSASRLNTEGTHNPTNSPRVQLTEIDIRYLISISVVQLNPEYSQSVSLLCLRRDETVVQ